MTPEERNEAVAIIKNGCVHSITTLLLVGVFYTLTLMLGAPFNIYLTIGFYAIGMVAIGQWITKLIYGAGPIYVPPEKKQSEEKE